MAINPIPKSSLGFHSANFSSKVRLMTQSQNKTLTLTADDARNLQSEITELLAKIVSLENIPVESQETVVVNMDGGGF